MNPRMRNQRASLAWPIDAIAADLQLGHRRKILPRARGERGRPGGSRHRHAAYAAASAAAGTGRIGARASRRRMSSRLCMPCDRSIADEIRGAKRTCRYTYIFLSNIIQLQAMAWERARYACTCLVQPPPRAIDAGREDRRIDTSGDPPPRGGENTRGSWKKPPAASTRCFVPKFWSGRAGGRGSKWMRKAELGFLWEITALPRGSC